MKEHPFLAEKYSFRVITGPEKITRKVPSFSTFMSLMKAIAALFLFILSCSALRAQITAGPDTVNEVMVTELSAIQTVNNTFIAALMIEHGAGTDAMIIYRSTDNGATWDSVFIKKGPNFLTKFPDPVLTTDAAGNVYAAVMGGNGSYYDIWIFKSTDDGLTWNFVSKPYGNSDLFCDLPSISARGNGLVYCSYSAGNPFITFKRSLDGGNTWVNAQNFPPPTGGNIYPSNLNWTVNNRLCLSYADYSQANIYFTSSKDSGVTWKTVKTIPLSASANTTKIVSGKNFPQLGIISNRPHTNTDVYYSTSLDTGNTWSTQVISNNSANCEGVMDATGNVHLIYNEAIIPGTTSRLAYRFSTDKGLTFSAAAALLSWPGTAPTAGEYQSLILGNDGLLHITYIDWNDQGAARHLAFAPLLTDIHQVDPNSHAPRIYPNPVSDVLNFESDQTNLNSTYELTSLEGKKILSGRVVVPNTSINISGTPAGIYLLRINNGSLNYIQKIIKR